MENKITRKTTGESRLTALRKERELSQRELGEELYIDQKAISRAENGFYTVPLLIALADYFGVTIDYIVCRSDERNGSTPTVSDLDMQILYAIREYTSSEKERLLKHIALDNSLKLHSGR
ncbi:MAG: helix-turn-helix transcriptional regulator [Butyrivibrio sp.]|nr:helix-turn-helix transcriptional regulator [Butyrivibrio sp.]